MLEVKSKVIEARCAIETIRERKEAQINDIDDEYEKIEEVLVGNLQNLMRYFRSEAKLKAERYFEEVELPLVRTKEAFEKLVESMDECLAQIEFIVV